MMNLYAQAALLEKKGDFTLSDHLRAIFVEEKTDNLLVLKRKEDAKHKELVDLDR